jgi:hypothetical protein
MDISKLNRVINFVNQSNIEHLRSELHNRGYRIFELDGKNVCDKKSFLMQAATDLPQPPELIAYDNWDAFNDNLWISLSEISETKVAFVWNDAQMMLIRGLPVLVDALDIFQSLSRQVAQAVHGFPRPVNLTIFLVGTGDNFPD